MAVMPVGKPAMVAVPLISSPDLVAVNVVAGKVVPEPPCELCGLGCVYVKLWPVGVAHETVFDNVRSLNVLKNLGLDYLGDLHQNIHLLMKSVNFGRKSMSIVDNTLNNYISLSTFLSVK